MSYIEKTLNISADEVYKMIEKKYNIKGDFKAKFKMVDMGGDFRDDNRVPVLESIQVFTKEKI